MGVKRMTFSLKIYFLLKDESDLLGRLVPCRSKTTGDVTGNYRSNYKKINRKINKTT